MVIEVPSVADRQAGAFSVGQAHEQGWTARQVKRRLESGSWVRIPGGSLAAAEAPAAALRDAWGVALAWPESIAVFRTAAQIWGLPVQQDGYAHVWAPLGRRHGGVVVHRARLGPEEVDAHVDGLWLTSRRRTAADCLALCDLDEALDLYAWLTTRRQLTRSAFMAFVKARVGHPGVAQLLTLARLTRTAAVSAAEYRLHELLRAREVTGWVANVPVSDTDGVIGVVDLLFGAQRLVIEVDGERSHSGHRAFVADRRRQNRLVNAGYRVLRFTWWDLTQRPDDVVAQIRRALKIATR